jgi:hypothetical protein
MPIGEIRCDSLSEFELGFHFLTPEERIEMIASDGNGGVVVRMTCDYCRQTLDSYPELALVGSPLQ